MPKRHTILDHLDRELNASLERSQRQREARQHVENESVTGQRVVRVERDWMGDVISVTLENGWTLRPRMNDSGESWIEIEEGQEG